MKLAAPARSAAFRALTSISRDQVELGAALVRTRDRLEDARDRALTTDLVTGTLRWRAALDYQLAARSGRPLNRLDPEVLDVLRLAAYQLLYLGRVPTSAVVNDAVTLTRTAKFTSASGFVNAVLRRLARDRAALSWPPRPNRVESREDRRALAEHLTVTQSHPLWLVERWVHRYGPEAAERWVRFNNETPVLTLAVNRLQTTREQLMQSLAEEDVLTEPTSLAPHGVRVLGGRAIGSRAFRSGQCVVQDEASQLIPELVSAARGDRVLDACAAPGGKTIALAAQTGNRGFVAATDVRPCRVRALADTLVRCRVTNALPILIHEAGPLPFRPGSFARVLLDAPCSGLGTIRRDPDIRWRRVAADLPRLAATQLDLLQRMSEMVTLGGRLVYSTCSSEPEENESVVAAFLERSRGFVLRPIVDIEPLTEAIRQLATSDGFLRTDPARHRQEAFFGAVLERVGADV